MHCVSVFTRSIKLSSALYRVSVDALFSVIGFHLFQGFYPRCNVGIAVATQPVRERLNSLLSEYLLTPLEV